MRNSLFFALILSASICASVLKENEGQLEVQGDPFMTGANRYLTASLSAYCPLPSVRAWNCYWCTHRDLRMNVTNTFSVNAIFGYAGYSNGEIIVGFRGTIGEVNWATDLDVILISPWQNRIPGALVHQGFYNAYLLVQNQVRQALVTLSKRYPQKKIVITGHSLGAGLASIAAADLALTPGVSKNIELWTYGSPRVGNAQFAVWMERRFPNTFRIVNKEDPIPALPPMVINYVHINREFWFHGPTQFTACATPLGGEDFSCSDSLGIRRNPADHNGYLGVNMVVISPVIC